MVRLRISLHRRSWESYPAGHRTQRRNRGYLVYLRLLFAPVPGRGGAAQRRDREEVTVPFTLASTTTPSLPLGLLCLSVILNRHLVTWHRTAYVRKCILYIPLVHVGGSLLYAIPRRGILPTYSRYLTSQVVRHTLSCVQYLLGRFLRGACDTPHDT